MQLKKIFVLPPTEEIGISRAGGSVRPRKFKEMYEAYDD